MGHEIARYKVGKIEEVVQTLKCREIEQLKQAETGLTFCTI
jgi:hypothetical protein